MVKPIFLTLILSVVWVLIIHVALNRKIFQIRRSDWSKENQAIQEQSFLAFELIWRVLHF